MKATNEYDMSEWAYDQCIDGNDTSEMRNLITHNEYVYKYCFHIKNIEEMWRKITDYYYAKWYCEDIEDIPELRKIWNKGKNETN